MSTVDTPAKRLRARFAESEHPLLTDADFADVRAVLDELADATDSYTWAVITVHGRSVYDSGRLSEREARRRFAEADRSDGRKPGLYRQRRWWADHGYGIGGWEQIQEGE